MDPSGALRNSVLDACGPILELYVAYDPWSGETLGLLGSRNMFFEVNFKNLMTFAQREKFYLK